MAVSVFTLRAALATDAGFCKRISSFLAKKAFLVMAETSGSNLAVRQAYAKKLLNNPFAAAQQAAFFVLYTDNFSAGTIEITPEGSGFAMTISTDDANAESQLSDNTTWDKLAALFG